MTIFLDLSERKLEELDQIIERLVSEGSELAPFKMTVDELAESMLNKLYFDALECLQRLFNENIAGDFWQSQKPELKVELCLHIAKFAGRNCKHSLMTEIVVSLVPDLTYELSVAFLRYFQAFCKDDRIAHFHLVVAESGAHVKEENVDELHKLFPECERLMNFLVSDPLSCSPSEVLNAYSSATFYEVALKYHMLLEDYAQAYSDVRLFCDYTDVQTMPSDQIIDIATRLMLCCLCSPSEFSFSEALEIPMIKSFIGKFSDVTSVEMKQARALVELLKAFSKADATLYRATLKNLETMSAPDFSVLSNRMELLELKFKQMGILNLCIKKDRGHVTLTFDQIAQAVDLPNRIEVQRVLIRAMSQKLIQGKIDSVVGIVNIEKTQIQAIDTKEAGEMAKRFDTLIQRASEVHSFMDSLAGKTLLNTATL